VTQKLIESHLLEGEMKAGAEIGLKIDQTLTQDATGTMVMLEFESTDEIMPAGSRVLPYRSNIPEISKFVFNQVDESYYERAMKHQAKGSFIVDGDN